MASLLVVSNQLTDGVRPETALPAVGLLSHDLRSAPADTSALTESAKADVIVIDGRTDLANARTICRLFLSSGITLPLLIVVTEGGLAAINGDWGVSDFILDGAGPAEFDARIRLLLSSNEGDGLIQSGGIVIDEAAYAARLGDVPLDLTYTEFELLKYLVMHPGRVFSREHLLADVWGYDYFGGTRTVDVHIRRLRAKLGPEHESLIGTVRNVGYRFSP
ncbi:MAG: response regulator transcription factor [Micropruina sp.]|uniref:winged helix-turn-helix transcriptional regulator n=1 Tax=Micropruina sp. TaxID=2737536 RepID=UPI0039E36F37